MECRSFIQAVLSELQEKLPLPRNCHVGTVKEWLLKAVQVTLLYLEPLFDI